MSRTFRRLKGKPAWYTRSNHRMDFWIDLYGTIEKMVSCYHSDSGTYDTDACPPKWFRTNEQRKFRHKINRKIRQGEEVIETDYKMPYYT